MKNSFPSINPADKDSLVGTFRHVLKKTFQNTDDMLPVQVVNFDAVKKTVQLQPLIMMIDTEGNQIVRAQIYDIPILQLGGGDFMISFPTKVGDLGFIKANDRDISNFLQTFGQSLPATYRIKNFSNGIFIPAVLTNYSIAEEDLDNLVIQSTDGTIKITLSEDTVTLVAPKIRMGNLTHPTDLGVYGTITATGTITPNTPIPP